MLVEAAANEAGASLISVRPSCILSKFQGESERSLKKIFVSLAATTVPTVLFFDEFDSLACSRGCGDDGQQGRRLLAELLLQLTALKLTRRRGGNVVVVAATNRIEGIDEAAVRRFETRVYVGAPTTELERVALIEGFLGPLPHALRATDLQEVALWSDGWSGSDIECMCRDAAMAPLRRAFPLGATAPVDEKAEPCGWDDERGSEEEGGRGRDTAVHGPGLVITLEDFRAAYLRATSHMHMHMDGTDGADDVAVT